MITRCATFFRKIRLFFSRSEWAIRLLDLPASKEAATKPGLILIQIDGLSHTQMNRALVNGKLPFINTLFRKERYVQHLLYSGMPSSTPAFQGELFYGIKGAVPAFSFKNRRMQSITRMYDPAAAAEIETELAEKGGSLLKGGCAYGDIFTGGAAESHFCCSSFGWNDVVRSVNPVAILILILFNVYSFIRTAVLLVVEFFIALVDCIRGLIKGHHLLKELKFVPTRVGICILLRELITIGTKIDIARGLPVIHLNFIGYDEQAHRRGPSSSFAHWSLQGIDDSIARIWRAANRARRRQYDIWIYSDHGQEKTLPYPLVYKQTVENAVRAVLSNAPSREFDSSQLRGEQHGKGIQLQHMNLLGSRLMEKIFGTQKENGPENDEKAVVVTAMGPLGMIYVEEDYEEEERRRLAAELVRSAHIPLVLFAEGVDQAWAWTREGEFLLPADKEKIFGINHPFLEDVARDLIAVCHHPDAGDFVISGWRLDGLPFSFPIENGSHAGPGPEETKGFLLLPNDIILPSKQQNYLRPMDLRHAAFQLLNLPEFHSVSVRSKRQLAKPRALRIMTYNVHSCIGMDHELSPERIARVIGQYAPDVVALQELDVGRSRTDGVNQALSIANILQMEFRFSPSIRLERGLYGNAILTTLPMQLVRAQKLPALADKPHLETRGAIWCVLEKDGVQIQIITTHLGLWPKERLVQIEALLGPDWLDHPDCTGPVILCGDFNALPSWPSCRKIRGKLRDAQLALPGHIPICTFAGRYPLARIDHLFVDNSLEVLEIMVPEMELAMVASDHRPLIVDVGFLQ